ncbi:N-acetylmuramoyl-L-alanine amidase [Spongiactinospora sp. TRM90649]|uniref:N-acetylmuramoyl-L-alanine amidase n=1 Tax=Spongiactinospora sp. TRM90649 TaxID=3031114 RepID=UPI0023F825DC|nr:N-acetylmuramoyl-L-alanine amidase [Spongiactinospora sp. TRM90649]MDF5753424.1 N-acetylmuramoyl-L-alanine amidase [Spongiactinospora sp. TRM90649]
MRLRPAPWTAAALAVVLVSAPLPPASSVSVAAPSKGADDRQRDYAEAARAHGVPESVLLGVSYLESRWDANRGLPSTSAGFGPMHLTDATAAARPHHSESREDPRGDDSRRPRALPAPAPEPGVPAESLRTLERAAELTGRSPESLRTDPAVNILGGAALLADYQRRLGAPPSDDPAQWYGAVARYSGAADKGSARAFADEVYQVIRDGAARTTDDGHPVRLASAPDVRPLRELLERLGLRAPAPGPVECPKTVSCEWIPAPYQKLGEGDGDYGNHDLSDRPKNQKIEYIVVHDTEEYYDRTLQLVQNPAYVSWHYTLRSQDGHIAQHVRAKDVAWHAGNWYVNAKAIGLEHEGFLARGGAWYTEAMYRTSAKLVRHLARKHRVPLDRAHILGHDNVPGTVPGTVQGMHEDPGPYWDWAHYFDLLGAPLRASGGRRAESVMIRPGYESNRPYYYGCDPAAPTAACPPHGSASVWLRTEPREDAPLVKDIGKHPTGDSLYSVYDHSARATTGQRYAVAGREGDWTAIWYLGQKAWFHNPPGARTAVPSRGMLVTPKPGKTGVPVYGRAYPEPEAYPPGIPPQPITPLQYTFAAGQKYTVGRVATSEYYRAVTFDAAAHQVVRGKLRYYQIQFGHRVMFVNADDVTLTLD